MVDADQDHNGKLDIDEFVNLLTMGDRIKGMSNKSKDTFSKITKARKISPADFFKAFKSMPSNFVPSFIGQYW
jgi:Ca2+-binding EF-hand superfamily protein